MSQRLTEGTPVVATGEPEALNLVKIDLSVLARPYLNLRLPDLKTMTHEVPAWQHQRNIAPPYCGNLLPTMPELN